jgi:hypothetical protein
MIGDCMGIPGAVDYLILIYLNKIEIKKSGKMER